MNKNCCKDKAAYFKVKDNHQANDLLKSPLPTSTFSALIVSNFDIAFIQHEINAQYFKNYFPPVLYHNPMYLRHRVLLI